MRDSVHAPAHRCTHAARKGFTYFGANDNRVHAVDAQGDELWTFSTNGDVVSSPAIGADGVIYVGCDDGFLYALLPDAGLSQENRLLWKRFLGTWVRSSPAIGSDGALYVGSDGNKLFRFPPP